MTPSKRRWNQFSLWTLLTVVTVVSVVFWLLVRLSIYVAVSEARP